MQLIHETNQFGRYESLYLDGDVQKLISVGTQLEGLPDEPRTKPNTAYSQLQIQRVGVITITDGLQFKDGEPEASYAFSPNIHLTSTNSGHLEGKLEEYRGSFQEIFEKNPVLNGLRDTHFRGLFQTS